MSDHGDSEMDATEINVDDSDSRSCGSLQNYPTRGEASECSNSPPPSHSTKVIQNEPARNHPFSISRLLGGDSRNQNLKSPSSEDQDSDKDRRSSWNWDESNNRTASLEDEGRSWGPEAEEKMSEKDDDDTGSTSENQQGHGMQTPDLLSPFRLFPGGSGLIYTGGGVIRVPAHRPPGTNGAPTGGLPTQTLIPPWSLQALQHSQQQAAAAGLHRASFLANLAAHPLQSHPHLKDRLAGELYLIAKLILTRSAKTISMVTYLG